MFYFIPLESEYPALTRPAKKSGTLSVRHLKQFRDARWFESTALFIRSEKIGVAVMVVETLLNYLSETPASLSCSTP
jgi:hypothetical protein